MEDLPIEKENSGRVPRYSDPRWHGYLSNMSPSIFRCLYENRLPEFIAGAEILGQSRGHPDPFTTIRPEVNYRVRSCTRYAIEENQRIQLFVELARGSVDSSNNAAFMQMGELMFQSHWSYTECGLGCEATDQLVELVREHVGEGQLYGAKVTGGGAGGTVAVLGSADAESQFRKVVEAYGKLRSFKPHVFEGSSVGADRFGILVVQESA